MTPLPAIRVCRTDLDRLERLIDVHGTQPTATALEEELSRADVLDSSDVPANLVTMNSRVRFVDEQTGEESEVRLVFPGAGDAADGDVSVMAPMGSALLGLSVGDSIEWPVPGNRSRRIRVVAIPYQPQAASRFDA
jgi:regulator of nucleoside diphosphate kinase